MLVTYRGFEVTELSVCAKTGECFVTVLGVTKDNEGLEQKKTKLYGISHDVFDNLRKRISNCYDIK